MLTICCSILLLWMSTLLEYYNKTHWINNLLFVLLKYINQFSMSFQIWIFVTEHLFTKCQHNARVIIQYIIQKLFWHNYLTPSMDILHYVVGDNIVIATIVIFTDQYRNVIMGLCGKIDIYQVIFPLVFFQKGHTVQL